MEYLYNLLIGTAKPVKAAYHNGEKFDSNMKIFDEMAVSKEIHLPNFPEQFSATSPYEFTAKTKMPLFIQGAGIECFMNGEWIPASCDNIRTASDILSIAQAQRFRFNPELYKKQGGEGSVEITACLIYYQGNMIPDITKTERIAVQ